MSKLHYKKLKTLKIMCQIDSLASNATALIWLTNYKNQNVL